VAFPLAGDVAAHQRGDLLVRRPGTHQRLHIVFLDGEKAVAQLAVRGQSARRAAVRRPLDQPIEEFSPLRCRRRARIVPVFVEERANFVLDLGPKPLKAVADTLVAVRCDIRMPDPEVRPD
jgi:hypothetical protein